MSNSWLFFMPKPEFEGQNIAVVIYCTNMNFALKGSYITARDVRDPPLPQNGLGEGRGC
jgi:hypothetical protein